MPAPQSVMNLKHMAVAPIINELQNRIKKKKTSNMNHDTKVPELGEHNYKRVYACIAVAYIELGGLG